MQLCMFSMQISYLSKLCSRQFMQHSLLRSYATTHRLEIDSALGCNVYISEGRDKDVINRLKAEADATHGVALANIFVDAPYNRTGFTLVSTQADRLTAAIVRLSRAALQLRDLRSHVATHPRLGIVDHISLHPLGSLVRRSAAAAAHSAPAPWPIHLHREDHYYHHQHHHQHKHRKLGHDHDHHREVLHNHHNHNNHHSHQVQQQQQSVAQAAAASGSSGSGSGSGHDTVWEPPPPGLAGLAVAASCAQYVAWHLSKDGESESAVAATAVAGQKPLEPAPALPVYLYGFAHPSRRCLSEVRRQLGYFRRAADGSWGGGGGNSNGNGTYQPQPQPPPLPDPDDLLRFPPDLGPSEPPPQSGLVTIGAVPWVVNYNVPLQDVDLAEAKWLARAVSERGGGLPGVEAMALKHADDTVEVACNLLDETLSSPHAVQARLEALASSRGLDQWAVLWGYRTNKSPEELLHAAAAALAAKAAEQRRRGG